MSHEVETMAWSNEIPWHGLGKKVDGNLSPHEMLVSAGLDWEVMVAKQVSILEDGNIVDNESKGHLIRKVTKNGVHYYNSLDSVGEGWTPLQNEEAFEFFKEFVDADNMTMETAGSLHNGKIVWGLAKVNQNFTIFNGDKIESYLLFTNPHSYGKTIDVRFTPIRVVCNNTLTMALNRTGNFFRSSHRTAFDAAKAKEALGIATAKLLSYKETALFLGSKEFKDETVNEFFDLVFPVQMLREKNVERETTKKRSKNSLLCNHTLEYQPGKEFAPNSWWQALNAVTYVTDHLMGRTQEARVENMWYGTTKDTKLKAFELATEFASKA
jgi:phage/plasmid-like protein (TIGR03299 family)